MAFYRWLKVLNAHTNDNAKLMKEWPTLLGLGSLGLGSEKALIWAAHGLCPSTFHQWVLVFSLGP